MVESDLGDYVGMLGKDYRKVPKGFAPGMKKGLLMRGSTCLLENLEQVEASL
jgi:hypothetical protein